MGADSNRQHGRRHPTLAFLAYLWFFAVGAGIGGFIGNDKAERRIEYLHWASAQKGITGMSARTELKYISNWEYMAYGASIGGTISAALYHLYRERRIREKED